MVRVGQNLRVRSLLGLTCLGNFEKKVEELGVDGYTFWIGKEIAYRARKVEGIFKHGQLVSGLGR